MSLSSSSLQKCAWCWLFLLAMCCCFHVEFISAQSFPSSNSTQPATVLSEVRALNAIFGRWRLKASARWNISGDPCSGAAIDSTVAFDDINPFIKCNCNTTTCHITQLRVYALDVAGPIPNELQSFPYIFNLNLAQNYLTGPLPSFIGNLTAMQYLTVGTNALSGPIPRELGKLQRLIVLGMGTNDFSGSLPPEIGNLINLEQWYLDSSGLSGELPQTLSNLKKMKTMWASDNNFTGRIPDYISSWTNLTVLRFQGNSFQGPIPSSLSRLTKMEDLRIGDITIGSSSMDFVSNMTSLNKLILRNSRISGSMPSNLTKYTRLQMLDLSFNNLTGQLPQSLFSLSSLQFLFLGKNSLSGSLPSQKSTSLLNVDLSYNQLSGVFPTWVGQRNLQLNLVANNFVFDNSNSSVLPSGLQCLQRDIPCSRGSPIYSQLAIACGSSRSIRSSDGMQYDLENTPFSAASYFVTDTQKWGVSNVGSFVDSSNASYTISTLSQFQNTLDPELFQNSRMSASSLRYYGIGLENGNYSLKLRFTEIRLPDTPTWRSVGRRIFDIYVQGNRVEKDFDIRKESGGFSMTAVEKVYTAPVTDNFLEIHFFWAGKGTCCVPFQGYYGPSISAISLSPDFTPTVSNEPSNSGSKKNYTGLVVGIAVAVAFVVILVILGLFWRHRRKRMQEEDEEFLGMTSKPNRFNFNELRAATDDFSPANKLGEGGFGTVFKGILPDGRVVAVKQLSASNQEKQQFMTEVDMISSVQHRNLVKLYGCCIGGGKRHLVIEYLENKSLSVALFGNDLQIDWSKRFEICLGTARGLAYLHEESRPRIVHRDVKAANILLDENLSPKISDFGLAKLYDDSKTHISTKIAGTFGYVAPEYALRGLLTEKADVYGFGVVALEVVSGRPISGNPEEKKVFLLEWAWNLHEEGRMLDLVDPRLSSYNPEEVKRVMAVALLCTQASPARRPQMSRVVSMLTGDIEASEVMTRPGHLSDWHYNDRSTTFYASSTADTGYSMPSSMLSPSPAQPLRHEELSQGR